MASPEVKLVFLGETQVGKTSIISSFLQPDVIPNPNPTVGARFATQLLLVDGVKVKLKIWDTAGQERFRALTPMYYRRAHVAILVFAVDAPDSLRKLTTWLADLERDTKEMPAVIITGNKIDLARKVSGDEGEKFAQDVGATYFESSAKTRLGITELFHLATTLAIESKRRAKMDLPAVVEVKVIRNKKKGRCCK
jgi:Ras-related protein Rab-5C